MPIEFRCIRCGQRLRVPETDHGKRARCPICNAIVDVPGEDQSAPVLLTSDKSDVIDYELFGEETQHVEITLDPGEVTVARMENLLHLTPGVAMESALSNGTDGSLLERISVVSRRLLNSNALRMTAFCNVAEKREIVAFAPDVPGRLVPLHLDEYGNQITCQGKAILCAARGTEINEVEVPAISQLTTTCQLSGDGIAVLQSAGQLIHRHLKAGKSLVVRVHAIVAFTSDIQITSHESVGIEEKIPIAVIRGPGEIWLQTGS